MQFTAELGQDRIETFVLGGAALGRSKRAEKIPDETSSTFTPLPPRLVEGLDSLHGELYVITLGEKGNNWIKHTFKPNISHNSHSLLHNS